MKRRSSCDATMLPQGTLRSNNKVDYHPRLKRHRKCYEGMKTYLIDENSFLYKSFMFPDENCNKLTTHNYLIGGKFHNGDFHDIIQGHDGKTDILVVFYNPHYICLDIVIDILRMSNCVAYIIGVTVKRTGLLDSKYNFPIITSGCQLIRKLKLLDPLGGGIYPLDCVLKFTAAGHFKNIIQLNPCHRKMFENQLSNMLNGNDNDQIDTMVVT
ncbi:uncharacterized protein Ecym_5415 [Eremothecium cymbalariae DBVPG|uniref:Uncharacterized protein n=1 Tax=Eremothecium cymbalariae (strain CBS 270.75 / DBVPG 7215 / KCTC 17166 / NRRL Y-17582) TaxID=931890 RepID=I6NDM7_ERECY|nr:hypothetical protein Ecym_5415 [Eremothecium cymbalariae DBVPG\